MRANKLTRCLYFMAKCAMMLAFMVWWEWHFYSQRRQYRRAVACYKIGG